MHASLWVLIGPNGILSLPLVSIRTRPPHSGAAKRLAGNYMASFFPMCVLLFIWNVPGEEFSAQGKGSSILVWFCPACYSPLRAHCAVRSLSRGMWGECRRVHGPLRTQSFTLWVCFASMCLLTRRNSLVEWISSFVSLSPFLFHTMFLFYH